MGATIFNRSSATFCRRSNTPEFAFFGEFLVSFFKEIRGLPLSH